MVQKEPWGKVTQKLLAWLFELEIQKAFLHQGLKHPCLPSPCTYKAGWSFCSMVHEGSGILSALGNVMLTTGSGQTMQALNTRHFSLSTKAPGKTNVFSEVSSRSLKTFLKMHRKQMPNAWALKYGSIFQKIYQNRRSK